MQNLVTIPIYLFISLLGWAIKVAFKLFWFVLGCSFLILMWTCRRLAQFSRWYYKRNRIDIFKNRTDLFTYTKPVFTSTFPISYN